MAISRTQSTQNTRVLCSNKNSQFHHNSETNNLWVRWSNRKGVTGRTSIPEWNCVLTKEEILWILMSTWCRCQCFAVQYNHGNSDSEGKRKTVRVNSECSSYWGQLNIQFAMLIIDSTDFLALQCIRTVQFFTSFIRNGNMSSGVLLNSFNACLSLSNRLCFFFNLYLCEL